MFPEWIILFDWGRFKFKVESKNKQQQLFKKNYIFFSKVINLLANTEYMGALSTGHLPSPMAPLTL